MIKICGALVCFIFVFFSLSRRFFAFLLCQRVSDPRPCPARRPFHSWLCLTSIHFPHTHSHSTHSFTHQPTSVTITTILIVDLFNQRRHPHARTNLHSNTVHNHDVNSSIFSLVDNLRFLPSPLSLSLSSNNPLFSFLFLYLFLSVLWRTSTLQSQCLGNVSDILTILCFLFPFLALSPPFHFVPPTIVLCSSTGDVQWTRPVLHPSQKKKRKQSKTPVATAPFSGLNHPINHSGSVYLPVVAESGRAEQIR